MKKSFAAYITTKNENYSNEKDRVDLCCRHFHKCDAFQSIESNNRNCECARSLQQCLEDLNTSLSKEFLSIYSKTATECNEKTSVVTSVRDDKRGVRSVSDFDTLLRKFRTIVNFSCDKARTISKYSSNDQT